MSEQAQMTEQLPKTYTFSILGPTGHERLVWNRFSPEESKEAQSKFYELVDKGYQMFATLTSGKKSNRRLFRFDPRVEEVVCIPPIAGG